MENYDHKKIERKWQKKWADQEIYKVKENLKKPKCYILDMFPYPSGEGLHVGHPKGYIATDVYSRYMRMNGSEVLHPMGWDAFGLPAENYAIKNKVHPRKAVEKNIARYKEQLENIGLDYDWSREINTTDPEYYKWTQWIFLKLFEEGMAYESHAPINWCPSCQTGLANEDLEDGRCERCGSEVEKKPMRQWMLRITNYADRLLNSLPELSEWPEYIKEMQRNWIGRKEGATFTFKLTDIEGQQNKDHRVEVFTTRPDTLFGVTFLVISPEKAKEWTELGWKVDDTVERYIYDSLSKSEIERTNETKKKTGVDTGVKAVHPATGEEVPVWVADYVLGEYGTGAIMAVPAHDDRDHEFAQKFELPILKVIAVEEGEIRERGEKGITVNSGEFSKLSSEDAAEKITQKYGEKTVNYRLQDWVFSRQRYWGEPIPLIHCEECGVVPVPENALPVVLPEVESYEPTGTGESPLAAIEDWVNTTCPACDGPGKRETNTMPQWAGSCWYYLRYMDPDNNDALVDPEKEKYWSPVDVYVGGAEHATRHLIYARFWHKFLYDIGVVSTKEPFTELHSVGLIQASDGRKMSKRFGNVINPDDIVESVGADTLRVYEMFMGPFENTIAWSTDNMVGSRRFLERIVRLVSIVKQDDIADLDSELHKTIKKVGEDIHAFKFNTAVSQLMIFTNAAENQKGVGRNQLKSFLKVLAPFAPHLAEELWHELGGDESIHLQEWPVYDSSLLEEKRITVVVQIDGKVRHSFECDPGLSKEELEKLAREQSEVSERIKGVEIEKIIVVPDRLVNFVTK